MNIKSWFQIAFASIVATQLPLFIAQNSMAQSAPASFECRQDGYYVTVAVRNNGAVSDPMIVWTTDEFSDAGYPPSVRCSEVTNRLNKALSDNGGTLNGLFLTAGRVNGLPVLCTVNNTRAGCNSTNVLFTLKRENNPNQVIQKLFAASNSSGSAIQQSGGQSYVNLQQLVNQLF